jgi:hypothetical protein
MPPPSEDNETMPRSPDGHPRRLPELFISALALIISVVGIYSSYYFSRESSQESKLALDIARQANDISLGIVHDYPKLEITRNGDISLIELPKQSIVWGIRNIGNKPISALTLLMIPASGLTYSLRTPMDAPKLVGGRVFHKMILKEQLLPDGLVDLHITKPVLAFLRNLRADYADPTAPYSSSINIRILPHEGDNASPIQSSGNKDWGLLSIEYIPADVNSDEFGRYINALEEDSPIFMNK